MGNSQGIDSYITSHLHQIEGIISVTGIAAVIWIIKTQPRKRHSQTLARDFDFVAFFYVVGSEEFLNRVKSSRLFLVTSCFGENAKALIVRDSGCGHWLR